MSDLLDHVRFDDSGYTGLPDGWYTRDGDPELTDRAHYVRDGRLTGIRLVDVNTAVIVAAQDGVILSVHRDAQGRLDILARRTDHKETP